MEPDLEKELLKGNVSTLGLNLRMEGFKKAGTNTFGISKDLFIDFYEFKYGIGEEKYKSWIEKLYHQKWTKEEIEQLAER